MKFVQLMLSLTAIAACSPFQIEETSDFVRRASSVPEPSQDPFYTDAVANISSYALGAIIRHRPSPGPIATYGSSLPLNIKGAHQILFRSTDSLGNAIAAVTTVLIPYNADSTKLLSYQEAYDTADVNCSPSYTLLQASNKTSAEVLLISGALEQGWYVSVPDYEGLQAEFIAGVISGQVTLDSVKAALASSSFTGVSSTARAALLGYSGGALASEWASELQPRYAPDLTLVGVAAGGLTPNVTSVLFTINGGVHSDLIPSGILGLSKAYSNLSTYIDQHLIEATKPTFYSALDCYHEANFTYQNIFMYFKNNGTGLLDDEVPRSVLAAAGQMGTHGLPGVPLYFYKTQMDEVSPIADSDELISQYCQQGIKSLQYVRNAVGDHTQEAVLGYGGALSWLAARLAGVPPLLHGCFTEDVFVDRVDLGGVLAVSSVLVSALTEQLGGPV